jgi:hypothetical protein
MPTVHLHLVEDARMRETEWSCIPEAAAAGMHVDRRRARRDEDVKAETGRSCPVAP